MIGLKEIPGKLARFFGWTESATIVPQEKVRRRVLMSLLVLSALLDLLFLVWILPSVYGISAGSFQHPEWWTSSVSLVVSIALFELARRGRSELAARILVGFAFVATWGLLYTKLSQTHDEREASRALSLLILSQMFGGLILNLRSNIVLALGHLVGLTTIPLFTTGLKTPALVGIGVLFGFSVLLSATTALLHHLDVAEINGSRARLEDSIQELKSEIQAREAAERTKSTLEEALLRTQRKEAVARLAGGFAHDFNNVLMGVMGQLERMRPDSQPEQKARVDDALRSVERASGLIKRMLAFSHPQDQTIVGHPCELSVLLDEGLSLARGAIPRGIRIEVEPSQGLWAVADQGQIVQVVLNLCVNARDALETIRSEGFRPTIRISMGSASEHELASLDLAVRPDGYAWIQVQDNGPGIPDGVKESIFDPFFTTKAVGKGTGLGLWMCDAIARGLGGQILLLPAEAGRGAAFRLYLPACEPVDSHFDPPSEEVIEALRRAPGRLLLIDDDDAIRDNIATALAEAGWDVVQATDGPGALRLFEADPDGFRMMVLDLSLPGMPGREVFLNVRRRRPKFPVLVISGYDLNAGEASPVVEGADGRLLKPFRTNALLREIERIDAACESR